MQHYIEKFVGGFTGYWYYLVDQILLRHPEEHNYFYWLIGLSLTIWLLEVIIPWRKGQGIFRKDFWLDGFYMFFNFFLFSLIGYNALSNVGVQAFNDFLGLFGLTNLVAINVATGPKWAQLLTMFVIADFIQWNVHRLLHKVPWMWEFHKLHHSVKEMGFAAHLRFHWMETIIYKTIQYVPLAMIGFGIQDFFLVHIFSIAIGHLNHSNLYITYGPLKYLLNNPAMHIWHHAKHLPDGSQGVNFGISLSVWDYVFNTVHMPSDGRDIELGFDHDEQFPTTFFKQVTYPFNKNRT
ncbi:MAG: sterol desaturase family protein [Cyclobacteriaceae bacterium]|nr:sterol desaturase family protein [Cyclobacteriaceae bacterium]